MRFNVPRDKELVDIMLQGGYAFCEEAKRKWRDPDYYDLPEEHRKLQVQRWNYAQYRSWQLATYLKGVLTDAPKRNDDDIKYANEHYG